MVRMKRSDSLHLYSFQVQRLDGWVCVIKAPITGNIGKIGNTEHAKLGIEDLGLE